MKARRLRAALVIGVTLCFFAAVPLAAQAAAGDLDASFGINGLVSTAFDQTGSGGVNALALQSDGKIVAAGQCGNGLCLARYNVNGSLDSSFGTDGIVTASPTFYYVPVGVALEGDGKIVVAGTCSDGQTLQGFCVTRYSAAGSLEGATNFTKVVLNAGSTTFATSMAVQGDGKIVVAGACFIPGITAVCLARYNTDLSLDTSFGGGDFNGYGCLLNTSPDPTICDFLYPPGTVANFIDGFGIDHNASLGPGGGVAIQSDGKIVVAGSCLDRISGWGLCLARYASNGALDSTVITDIGQSYTTNGVALQNDGKIVVVGLCTTSEFSARFCLARYNANLSLDSSFGADGVNTALESSYQANAVALQSDGKIVAAGRCDSGFIVCLARYNANGSLDSSFGVDGRTPALDTGVFNAVAVQSDGKIVAAGGSVVPQAAGCGRVNSFCLMRFDGGATATNHPPVAVGDTYAANQGNQLSVPAASGVLANDSDTDAGTTLNAVLDSGPTHGTLALASNGSFQYTPAADYSGTDTFSYRASDGSLTSNLVTVTINVVGLTSIIDSQQKLTSGQKSALKDKLAAAKTFFTSGKLNPACGKLSDFIDQVNSLTPSKLSPSTATVLINSADALKRLYGCPG